MRRTDLLEMIQNGENSGVEFKRDDVRPDVLAREISALLNLAGGHILLGVEDDGPIVGLRRPPQDAEEWVMNLCRNNIQPPVIPFYEVVGLDGAAVGVVSLPAGAPDKPYKAKRGSGWVTYVRVGNTSRAATREEEARLYQAAGRARYDLKPVPGAGPADIDTLRLANYFRDIRQQQAPDEEDSRGWEALLLNTGFMVRQGDLMIPTTAGILLFGRSPSRFLPQCGITAVAYPGTEKGYAALERTVLRGPIVPLLSAAGSVVDAGLIERANDFVRHNISTGAWNDPGGRRHERWDYPVEAVRETAVNAITHRDYSITLTDIELSVYSDRLEVISPGSLPNAMTVDKMRQGCRATRNELIKEVLRDYRYIEATGLGVPRKIIRGMREHNGTEPDLIEEPGRFTVRLWKGTPER